MLLSRPIPKEEAMQCPKCRLEDYFRSGFVKGKQRYACRNCRCHYTKSEKQGYPLQTKRKALQYYLDGMGFRRIERLLCISHVTVMNWVREMSKKMKALSREELKRRKIDLVELDELCTYIKKRTSMLGLARG